LSLNKEKEITVKVGESFTEKIKELELAAERERRNERENTMKICEERDSMAQEIKTLQLEHKADLERLKNEMESLSLEKEEEITVHLKQSFTEKIKDLELAAETERKNLQDNLNQIKENHKNQLDKMVSQEDAEAQFAFQLEDITASVAFETGQRYEQKIKSLELRVQNDHHEAQKRTKKIEDEHATELDEMIVQLDGVINEHNEKLNEFQLSVKQKEVIITALGSQLAEANQRILSMEKETMNYKEVIEHKSLEIEKGQEEVLSLQNAMKRIQQETEQIRKEDFRQHQHEIEKVQSEMLTAAENQFAEANKYYLKLNSEYDSSLEEIAKLKKDLDGAQVKLEVATKEKRTENNALLAEVAQLKLDVALLKANTAKANQNHNNELDSFGNENKTLRSKLEEVNSNCASAHMSLAAVVTAKEQLQKENKEISSVCEELMAMVESQQQK